MLFRSAHTHTNKRHPSHPPPFAPTHPAQRSLSASQPCRLSPTKSRLRIPPPTPCIGPALASTRRNRPSKPHCETLDSTLGSLDLRPFCISLLLEVILCRLLASTTTPPPPPNRRSGHKLNSRLPTHYTSARHDLAALSRHALSTRNLVVQTSSLPATRTPVSR